MKTEKQILAKCKELAKEFGLRPLRISFRAGVEAGWPDLFIFGPNRNLLGAETKRPGKEPTPIQLERGKEMVMFGFAWAKIDSYEDAAFTIENFARHCVGQKLMTRDEWEAREGIGETRH